MIQPADIPMTETRRQNIIQTVGNYSKRLFQFIRGKVKTDQDAEDILQDVWYQFSNVVDTETIEQASAWLFTVARNKITDKYRKQQPVLLEDELGYENEEGEWSVKEILLAEGNTPETEHLRNLFWQQLFAALNELPEEQKQVFVWNELEDISFNDISAITGEKVNTLISRKRYAVLHLRNRLQELYREIIEK